jgi:hypothetical protein
MGRSCRRIAPSSAITFELLGQMLGVRRTTVTMAAQLLQSAGLIRYRRGLIQIVDRPALEDIACECYAVVRHNADKIFARPSPSAKPTDKWSMGDNSERTERLQFMLSADELAEIEKFRFEARMPSRAAAIRELLRRGLSAVKKHRSHWLGYGNSNIPFYEIQFWLKSVWAVVYLRVSTIDQTTTTYKDEREAWASAPHPKRDAHSLQERCDLVCPDLPKVL